MNKWSTKDQQFSMINIFTLILYQVSVSYKKQLKYLKNHIVWRPTVDKNGWRSIYWPFSLSYGFFFIKLSIKDIAWELILEGYSILSTYIALFVPSLFSSWSPCDLHDRKVPFQLKAHKLAHQDTKDPHLHHTKLLLEFKEQHSQKYHNRSFYDQCR
jgi:hypothetical protein